MSADDVELMFDDLVEQHGGLKKLSRSQLAICRRLAAALVNDDASVSQITSLMELLPALPGKDGGGSGVTVVTINCTEAENPCYAHVHLSEQLDVAEARLDAAVEAVDRGDGDALCAAIGSARVGVVLGTLESSGAAVQPPGPESRSTVDPSQRAGHSKAPAGIDQKRTLALGADEWLL